MLKILAVLLPFIKELFFDNKHESDFTSPHFNIKKFLMFVSWVLLLVSVVLLGSRLVLISANYVKLEKQLTIQLRVQEKLEKDLAYAKDDLYKKETELFIYSTACAREGMSTRPTHISSAPPSGRQSEVKKQDSAK